jgi:hypothetical protein
MSVNKYLPHVFVFPEDDANRQLANGFQLNSSLDNRRMQILEVAGGWGEVLNRFKEDHVPEMDKYASRFMVLLVDFDDQEHRLDTVKAAIPERLKERVFVLGAWSEPEKLRQSIGSYEFIGLALAEDCRKDTEETWMHDLLRHNAGELVRLREHVRPILFSND